jgi:hypothetical protein
MKSSLGRAVVLSSLFVASALGTGAAAADNGFYVFPSAASWGSVSLDANYKVIQDLALPPGRYIANASAALESGGGTFLLAECVLMLNGAVLGDISRGLIGGSVQNFLTLPLTVGFTTGTAQDLQLACRGDVGVRSQPSPMTAVRVNQLTVQKGFQP